jgi:lipopolysaccharide/colanic/teichoic acid biosynthesis glycosyltransferase
MSARRALQLGDALTALVVVGLFALHATRHDYAITSDYRLVWTLAYLGMLLLATYAAGLPGATGRRGPVLSAILASGGAAIAISLCQLLVGSALLPRFVVFASAAIVGVLWGYLGTRVERTRGPDARVDRVLYVGRSDEGERLERDLLTEAERQATVVMCATTDDMHPLGSADEPLVDAAVDCDATVLVLGNGARDDRGIVRQASVLHEAGVRVRSVTDFYDEWLGKLPVPDLQRMSLMFDISEIHEPGYPRVKRVLDVMVAFFGVIAFALAVPFVWTINLVANRGPLFYRQPRVGRSGRVFDIVKFRTMQNGESTEWTAEDDERVTRFGRVLRRTHLDELPQFVNILRGDLSIVGPRPEQPQYVAQLGECLPFYRLRHLVRPGLTGWAQVKYGYAGSSEDALEKLQYDFYYLQHQSLLLDLRVIARTTRATLGAGNGR